MAADDDRTPLGAVLVVEDEMLVQMLILDVVSDLGREALDAADGPSALRILESDASIDLIITDIGLPGLDGRRLVEAARRLRPGLKVLFVTGHGETVQLADLAGGVDVIGKPFALDDLSGKITTMLGDG